ncbi:helix-turn-helix transcriptional regulator [Mangrovihabitans endophyticus]|uniref:Transcriptional regulator, AlpA family n=1 Tax=Mangrovihabitans endophyticus TaxID=1751298 RepID=A0A8J3C2M4_9ACTN|nr:hypothetical protein [Mangrovihabitans endophyticus]GGL01221.1 hypothetical protein GCM10012284_39730 [Mangrovihabitans endophyticus]
MTKHLMSAGEIQQRLGVSRQRVHQLTARPDFPAPYEELSIGRIWIREDVEDWIAKHRPALAEVLARSIAAELEEAAQSEPDARRRAHLDALVVALRGTGREVFVRAAADVIRRHRG